MFQLYGSNKKDDLHQYAKRAFPKIINKADDYHESLLHQLRVQLLTLEMQNQELLDALESATAAQERLNAVFEFVPLACLVITRDGAIKQITHCAAKMFGMTGTGLSGLPLAKYICQDDQPVLFRFLESAFSGEENPHCEVVFQFGENRNCAVMEAKVDQNLQICLVTISDSSHLQRQDSERLNELAHVTRLGLMGEMASGIAHEVNQPLAAICSYAQACVAITNSESPDLTVLSEISQKMQKQAFRAGEIIHHMREFVRINPKHRTSVDIYALINEAVSLCTADIRQNNIKLSIDQEINLPRLNDIDHIQIEQVLINLIRNAIDVLQCLSEGSERRLSIQVSSTADNEISIRVKDNGAGIPLEEQLKIFMPFFTTKNEGMGMGLSISRSIIEAHGGFMRFNSKPGKGSSFYFTLPIK